MKNDEINEIRYKMNDGQEVVINKNNIEKISQLAPQVMRGHFKAFLNKSLLIQDFKTLMLLPAIIEAFRFLNGGGEIEKLKDIFREAPHPEPFRETSPLSRAQEEYVLNILLLYYYPLRERIKEFSSIILN